MGGIGSGPSSVHGTKDTTDDCLHIDIRHWAREGLLAPGNSFDWRWLCDGADVASIHVEVNDDWLSINYRSRRPGATWKRISCYISVDWTDCHFGGQRAWFRCPATGCHARCASLYLRAGIFACRHCHHLTYESQRERQHQRLARKAERIRRRLGWPTGILSPGGAGKPKGMHMRTYIRLQEKHDAAVKSVMNWAVSRFRLL